MAISYNCLSNLIDLKLYLKLPEDDTSENEFCEDVLNRGTAILESLCNRRFKNVDHDQKCVAYTEYFSLENVSSIYTKIYPIFSISSVHDDADRVYGTDTLIDPGDYSCLGDDAEAGIVRFDTPLTGGWPNAIQIVYKGGYSLDTNGYTTPEDLIGVMLELCGIIYKGRDNIGISSKSFSDGSAAFFNDKLSTYSRDLIFKYTKMGNR
jgi:hypothetical protein